tara:strand:+ start:438 stop:1256 length:819 start_codon:yes stop_codon:yes gene_type:complete
MSIKQNGGVFGRNPTFNDVTIEGQLTFDGDIDINSDLTVEGTITANDVNITDTTPNLKFTDTDGNNLANLTQSATHFYFDNDSTGAIRFRVDSNSEKLRVDANGIDVYGDIETTGNLVIATSGKGIDFSATSGTGTSELLDDYEEGSFVPDVRFGGASPSGITYAAQTGTYTKIGNVVEFRFIVTLTAKGSQTGNFEVYGLPYVAASSDNGVGVSSFFNNLTFTGEEVPIGRVENSAVVEFRYPSSGLSTRMTNSQIESNTDLRVSGIYKTA